MANGSGGATLTAQNSKSSIWQIGAAKLQHLSQMQYLNEPQNSITDNDNDDVSDTDTMPTSSQTGAARSLTATTRLSAPNEPLLAKKPTTFVNAPTRTGVVSKFIHKSKSLTDSAFNRANANNATVVFGRNVVQMFEDSGRQQSIGTDPARNSTSSAAPSQSNKVRKTLIIKSSQD